MSEYVNRPITKVTKSNKNSLNKQQLALATKRGLPRGLVGGVLVSISAAIVACSSDERMPLSESTVHNRQLPMTTLDKSERDLNGSIASPVAAAETREEATRSSGKKLGISADADQSLNFYTILPAPVAHESKQATDPATQHATMLVKPADSVQPQQPSTENYQHFDDNPVVLTSQQATSTFSIDVDTGAYANVRRFLENGQLPPVDAVRIEEMINYFSYDYPVPTNTDVPFSVTTELSVNPWNSKTRLLHVGLQGYKPASIERPAANLVFLIDVSGSMHDANKLGLLKTSIKMLSQQLSAKDSVSIAVYAGASGVALEPTPGNDTRKIAYALDQLAAGGSTNGEGGIKLAYDLAAKNFKSDGINRVILATDGDFNVGISDIEKLKSLIAEKRESGVALSTLGFGTGNYNDHLMEQLADTGNGAYAYIDTLNEARKVLVDELDAQLLTIASDVKIQLEFNPEQVSEYRLIGYVNRRLQNEDFNNDKVDAGEIGAGHTVTALYEVALKGEGGERHTVQRYKAADTLESQTTRKFDSELGELRLRYKAPGETASTLISSIIDKDILIDDLDNSSENFRFSAAVAAFGQKLRGAKYMGDFELRNIAVLATEARGDDPFGYRAAFVQLVRLAESLQTRPLASGDTDDTRDKDESGDKKEG